MISSPTVLVPRDFHKVLLEYTREGYRVLALAWRPLRVAYTRVMRLQRSSIERQLQFLGLLVMENRLKPESAPVIELLKKARIRPVMVTGKLSCSFSSLIVRYVIRAHECCNIPPFSSQVITCSLLSRLLVTVK